MRSYMDEFSWREWIWALPAAILVAITYRLGHRLVQLSDKVVLLCGICIANGVYLTFLLSYNTQPASDWANIWRAAVQMANGTFTDGITNGTYMHEIPYQLGLAFFESLLIRVFGANFSVLKILNLLLMNLITLSVYHFTKRKASKSAAVFAYGASVVFLCWSMTVPQFTNHHMGFLFLYLSLACFEKCRYGYAVAAGISLALLNFFRPMGSLVIIAFLCATVYEIIAKKQWKGPIVRFFLTLAGYTLCLLLLDSLLLGLGYTDVMVSRSSRNLYHKIICGTYESDVDGTMEDFDYDYVAYDEAFRQELINQIKTRPVYMLAKIANKMCRYLGLYDYGFEMTYDHDKTIWTRYPVKAIYCIQWFQYIVYVLIAMKGYLCYTKKNGTDLYQIFYVGNTLVYLFVEAQSTYRFESYFYLLFLVGVGLDSFDRRKEVKEIASDPAKALPLP